MLKHYNALHGSSLEQKAPTQHLHKFLAAMRIASIPLRPKGSSAPLKKPCKTSRHVLTEPKYKLQHLMFKAKQLLAQHREYL